MNTQPFTLWLNGWVFVYELSGCGFESSCSHLNFRFRACFEQGVRWHSSSYTVWFTLKRVRDTTRTYSQLTRKGCSNYIRQFWIQALAEYVRRSTSDELFLLTHSGKISSLDKTSNHVKVGFTKWEWKYKLQSLLFFHTT